MGKKHDLNQDDPVLAEAVRALRASRQAAADAVTAREAAIQADPVNVARREAVTQGAYEWAASMGLEIRSIEVNFGYGYPGRGNECYAHIGAVDGDLREAFHICIQDGQVCAYLHSDPVRYDGNRHLVHRIENEEDLGAALSRAESEKHRIANRG